MLWQGSDSVVMSILSEIWLKTVEFSLEKFANGWVGGGGTIDYSVSPGPYFWLWNFEFVLD